MAGKPKKSRTNRDIKRIEVSLIFTIRFYFACMLVRLMKKECAENAALAATLDFHRIRRIDTIRCRFFIFEFQISTHLHRVLKGLLSQQFDFVACSK